MKAALALLLCLCLTGCAAERYDRQGNGTSCGARLERWAIHTINGQHY